MPALPPRISEATAEILKKLNVDIHTNARVTEVTAEGVKLANGNFIPSELVVWAAGVKGPDVLKNLDGLEVSRSNTLVVKPTLQTTLDPDIFAFGDCAYLVPDGQTLRRFRRALRRRISEASYLVKVLQARVKGARQTTSRSSIATSARWFRSGIIRPSAASWASSPAARC